MEKRFDILIPGELNPDLILRGDVTPQFGQVEKLVDDANLAIGSSSAIFACGAARLGLRVAFVGKIGPDEFGDFMVRRLQAYGIDTSGVIQDPALRTGLSVILVTGSDRAILTYPGAIPTLQFEDIPLSLLSQSRHLHLASYFLQTALKPQVPALFRKARQLGLTISLDTNYDPEEHWNSGLAEALSCTDVFMPNAGECVAISGAPDLASAIQQLSGQVRILVVKLGAEGAVGTMDGEQVRVPSLPVRLVDTVGAGDSFNAGFLYGYLAGWSLPRALRMGVVCGALSTRAAGGTEAQPDLAEAMQYLLE